MIRTWITACIALALILLGLGIFYYKTAVLSYPLAPSERVDSWYVEFTANIDPRSTRGNNTLDFTLVKPQDNLKYVVTNLQIFAPDFGLEDDSTEYELTKRALKKTETILVRYNIFAIDNPSPSRDRKIDAHDDYKKRNRISNPSDKTKILYETIDTIIDDARDKSASPISYARQVVKILNEDKKTARFLMDEMDAASKEAMIVKILGASNVKARIANGFELQDRNDNLDIISWLEVYDDKKWVRVSTTTDKIDNLKDYYLWWVGDQDVLSGDENLRYNYSLSTKANRDGSLTREIWLEENRNPILNFFSLQTLPLEQQFVVQILLLLPLGALLVSFFRQMIGFQTFGTFMPVLIALAFRETGLIYGIGFFFGIIMVGLIARAYITRLHLLMVPRLSAVMSVIVLFIILLMLATKSQNISLGISVALFPVVIITMFIERMSTILDEAGPADAFYGFIGSMFVATVIYILVLNSLAMHLMFVFPELLFVVIAGCLLLGRYNGYKLMEYWRFKQIQKKQP